MVRKSISLAKGRKRLLSTGLASLVVASVLAGLVPAATAAVTNQGLCVLKYQGATSTPSAAAGSFVPTGTLVTFGLGDGNAARTLTAASPATADLLAIAFPVGTVFDAALSPSDFTIQQTATGPGAPCLNANASGTATAPNAAGSFISHETSTITLKVQAASLTTGMNAGKGLVAVSLSRADAIRLPSQCAGAAIPLTVTHLSSAGATKSGPVDNPFTFTAGPGCIRFLTQPQNTGRGLPFVPVVRVLVTNSSGGALPGRAVTLTLAGSPATAFLANGPGQDQQPAPTSATPPVSPLANPTATTDALGIASFPGLTVVVDDAAFKGGAYQIRASSNVGVANSEPFRVGKTSPPWQQFNFNAQKTGWSPNIADFSDPASRSVIARIPAFDGANLGDVVTTPLLVDINGGAGSVPDGVLDLAFVNSVQDGFASTMQSVYQYWNLASCSGPCAPVRFFKYGMLNDPLSPTGPVVTNLAAAYRPDSGPDTPPLVYASAVHSTNLPQNPPFLRGQTYLFIGSVGASAGSNSNLPAPTLVAYVGPAGSQAWVLPATDGGGSAGPLQANIWRISATGGVSGPVVASVPSPEPFGGALASAEMRSGNYLPEIVLAGAHQAGTGASLGWDSSTIAVCSPSPTAGNCIETTTLSDAAVNGIAIADMDGDGKMEIVANGLRSLPAGTSTGQLSVFKGTVVPINSGSPTRLPENSDFYNTPAMASLDAVNQDGVMDIVNVNHGAPPLADTTGGDTYSDVGNVFVRGLATGALDNQGVWARGGTSQQPKESPGGGILLTLDPRPAHGYRPDYLFGSKDGTVVATRVTDSSTTNLPAELWTMGGLGTTNDQGQGIPLAPLVAGDVTGDCHAEIFAGLGGGLSGRGEVAVLRGKNATSPGIPGFTSPLDYDVIPPDSTVWTGAPWPNQDTAPGYGFKARFAWNMPATDGGLPIVAYKVFRGTAAGFTPSAANLVAIWPSGTVPSFSPTYRAFTDAVPGEGDYYYKVAAVTCYTLAKFPLGVDPLAVSAPFYVEVKFGKADALRAVPSGDPAYPAPVQVIISWEHDLNYARPHGCEWVDSYNLYKLQTDAASTPTNVVSSVNKVTTAPWPITVGPTVADGAPYAYTDTNVVRAPAAGPGGLYDYVVNPVNCVGEQDVFPAPPYTPSPPYAGTPLHQVFANTRVPVAPVLDSAASQYTPLGLVIDWTTDPVVNGCGATRADATLGTIEGYNIYRGTSPFAMTLYDTILPDPVGPVGSGLAAPWTTPNPDTNPSPGAVSTMYGHDYYDANVSPNTVYYYKVTTVNCVGESLLSNVRFASLPTLPDAPTGLIARPVGDPAYATIGKQVRLDWTAPAAWGSCTGGFGYEVWRRSPAGGGSYAVLPGMPITSTSFTDSVAPGTTYDYVVRSVCTTPDPYVSVFSAAATADTNLPLAPGGSPTLSIVAGPAIRIDWSAAAQNPNNANCNWIEGFRVYRSVDGDPFTFLARSSTAPAWPRAVPTGTATLTAPAPAAATSYDDAGIAIGSTYAYQVTAVNCVGEGPASPSSSLTPTAPAAPTGLVATPYGQPAYPGDAVRRVQLDWSPVTALGNCAFLSGYNVYRNGGASPIGSVAAPATTYTDVGVGLTTYSYEVTAACVTPAVLEGARSASASAAVLLPNAPAAPGVMLIAGSTVRLTWSDPGSVSANCLGWQEGYRIYRSVNGGAYALLATVNPVLWPRNVSAGGHSAPATSPPLLYDDPIAAGALHGYKVAAVNCVGEGAQGGASTIGAPLEATLSPAASVATPLDTALVTPTIRGGVPAYLCSWSIAPAGGTFTPPAGAAQCTGSAAFTGGAIGQCYTVQMDVLDSANPVNPGVSADSATADVCIVDNDEPVADFGSPPNARPNQGVAFVDLSYDTDGAIVSWTWDFGDGTWSNDPFPMHAFASPGVYVVRLTVMDDRGAIVSVTHTIVVGYDHLPPEPVASGGAAVPPWADAGDDLQAPEGSAVRLSGSAPYGATYSWRQVSGPAVALAGANTAEPTFTAPRLASDVPVDLVFSLVVADGPLTSMPDFVTVTVTSANRPPVPSAGAPQSVLEGAIATLDASGSRDPDGDNLTFAWRQVAGPAVALSSASGRTVTFAAPAYAPDLQLQFEVAASDGRSTVGDTVLVWVQPRPVLDAAFTFRLPDPGKPLTFEFHAGDPKGAAAWSFGDGATALGADVAHTFAAPGNYTVRLERSLPGASANSEQTVVAAEPKSPPPAESGLGAWALWVVGIGALLAAIGVAGVLYTVRERRRNRGGRN